MRHRKYGAVLMITILLVLSVSSIFADCKLLGLIGLNGKSLTENYCSPDVWGDFTNPCLLKLKALGSNSTYPNNNPNGWALAAYCEETPAITMLWRNNQEWIENTHMAINSVGYSQYMDLVTEMNPRIILGHVRAASNPATVDLPDPHPFTYNLLGKEYSFMHNGTLYDYSPNMSVVMDLYRRLIGTNVDPPVENWLALHGLNPQQYDEHYIDSEIYFYWIMKCIDDNNGDVLSGLKTALQTISSLPNSVNNTALNFILSDGYDLYAYRYTGDLVHPLAYFYDMDDTSRNYYYCGIMTVFPNQWLTAPYDQSCDTPNNVQTHSIDNNELVYISSTGNIVRLPKFATPYAPVTQFSQKRDYHQGYNWEGFPVLNVDVNTHTAPISPYFDYFINPSHGDLQDVEYNGIHVTTNGSPWSNNDYPMYMTRLYKMQFNDDSPSIHTTTYSTSSTDYSYINCARMYDNSWYVIDNVVADQEYWISYTLLPTQNIADAFGENFNNVKSVKAENWYYEQYIAQGKSGGPIEDPSYMYTTEGKNMEFGQGYIVTFKTNMDYFSWNRSYIPEMPTPGKQKPEFFEWEDGPEYIVIDIYEAQNGDEILEVGAFQGEKCIGAVKPDKFPCQLLVYPDYSIPYPIEFQIIYKAKGQPATCNNYQVYNPTTQDYLTDFILPEVNINYIVKLTDSPLSHADAPVNPLASLTNYPNPFNPQTSISFKLKFDSNVQVSIYNVKGQLVKDFGQVVYKSGLNRLEWNGTDYNNKEITGGIYFLKVSSGKNVLTHKMVMLK